MHFQPWPDRSLGHRQSLHVCVRGVLALPYLYALADLKSVMILDKGTNFPFALGPVNYVASSADRTIGLSAWVLWYALILWGRQALYRKNLDGGRKRQREKNAGKEINCWTRVSFSLRLPKTTLFKIVACTLQPVSWSPLLSSISKHFQ